MEELKKLLNELESKIPFQELLNPIISKSSVGWHIEHVLLTANLVIESIYKSNPDNYNRTFSLNRFLVFTMNKIPRGKIQAPQMVRPLADFTTDSLKTHLEKVKRNSEKLNTLSPNSYFKHPFMGQLNLKPTIRFITIHTQHHINIIKDIIESKSL
jgi:hypothetical protein